MAAIKPNVETIKKHLKGPRSRFSIVGHEGLYLQARGDGNGSYLLRYRVAGKRQAHVLHNDARNAVLSQVIEAKDRWIAQLKLDRVDPKAQLEEERAKALADSQTFKNLYEKWRDQTGARRKRELSSRTREEYDRLFKLHIEPYLGTKSITAITTADIKSAVEKARKATTDYAKGHRGLQAAKACGPQNHSASLRDGD